MIDCPAGVGPQTLCGSSDDGQSSFTFRWDLFSAHPLRVDQPAQGLEAWSLNDGADGQAVSRKFTLGDTVYLVHFEADLVTVRVVE